MSDSKYFEKSVPNHTDNSDEEAWTELSWGFRFTLAVMRTLRPALIAIERKYFGIVKPLLRRRGIHLFYVVRSADGVKIDEEPYELLRQALVTAKDVKFAVGEIGHRLMERPDVLEPLMEAYETNSANIEVVHGPRVDPLTVSVFNMVAEGKVQLYRMPEYARHHFILTSDGNGQRTVIDEGVHLETLWGKRQGQLGEVHASQARLYYVTQNSRRHYDQRLREFERRKASAVKINSHPGLFPPQKKNAIFYFLDALVNVAIRHFLQPLLLLAGIPIDVIFEKWYKVKHLVVKETKPLVENPELPAKAEQWLTRKQMEIRTRAASDPIQESIYAQTDHFRVSHGFAVTSSTLTAFRDLHSMSESRSVGSLDISDNLFKALIFNDIYLVEELEGILQNKVQDQAVLSNIYSRQIEAERDVLERAVAQYRLAGEEHKQSTQLRIARILSAAGS